VGESSQAQPEAAILKEAARRDASGHTASGPLRARFPSLLAAHP
jgi:hypothetical protein